MGKRGPKKGSGGRPRKPVLVTPRQIEAVSPFLTQEQIGDFFNVSDDTIYRRIHEDPKLSRAYSRARARFIRDAGSRMLKRGKKNGRIGFLADKFLLETQGRWSATVKQEVSGPGGGPIEVTDPYRDISVAETRKLLAEANAILEQAKEAE